MTILCPKIDGMTCISKDHLPVTDIVREAPLLESGRVVRATDYYQKIIRTYLEAGYQFQDGDLFVSSFYYTSSKSNSIPEQFKGLIPYLRDAVDSYVDVDSNNLSVRNFLQFRRSEEGERFYTIPISEPGNPLSELFFKYGESLYVDSHYGDNNLFSTDNIIIYLGAESGDKNNVVFYLHDWLSGCVYVSDPFTAIVNDPSINADRIVSNIFQSLRMYMQSIDYDLVIRELISDIKPYDLKESQLYVSPKHSHGKGEWKKIFRRFRKVAVSSVPRGREIDLAYSLSINEDLNSISYLKNVNWPNRVELIESRLQKAGFPTIRVNGSVQHLEFYSTTDNEIRFKPGETSFEHVSANKDKDSISIYSYYDKYGNYIIVNVWQPCRDIFAKGYIQSVYVSPPISFVNEKRRELDFINISVDLSPVGGEEYKDLFQVPIVKFVKAFGEDRTIYSDTFGPHNFSAIAVENIEKGIFFAEELFELFSFVKKVSVRDASTPNAFADRLHGNLLKIHGKDMLSAIEENHGWIVTFHETMHLFDHHFNLSSHPRFRKHFRKFPNIKDAVCPTDLPAYMCEDETIPHPFMASISEKEWFGGNFWFGHPWRNEKEFFVSLMGSIMHPDLKERYLALSPDLKKHYIDSLRIIASTIKERILHGDRLTIYQKLTNTIFYLE